MAFLTIGDEKGITIEVVVFPKVFEQYKDLLRTDNVILIEGKLDMKNDKPTILAQRITSPKSLVV